MSITATIAGVEYGVIPGSIQPEDRVDDRDTLTISVLDTAGTTLFQKYQTVVLTDSILGTIFTGIINTPTMQQILWPANQKIWQLQCVDQAYRLDKELSNWTYKNQYGGTILAHQLQTYSAADHVSAEFALRWEELMSAWQQGTHSGTVATNNTSTGNPGAGDLELASGGSQVMVSGSGSGFVLANGLLLTGYASSGYSSAYTNRQIWSESQAITNTLDYFAYDVWVNSSSPAIKAGADFICSDGTVFSASSATDLQYLGPSLATDLSGLANDQWYTRRFYMPSALVGKTIKSVLVGFDSSAQGQYTAYFRRIAYTVSGGSTTFFFWDNSTLATNVQSSNIGYTNVSLAQVQVEDKKTVSTHSGLSIGAAGIVQSSQMTFNSSFPNGSTGVRETSIDNGASWQVITSGQAVPNLLPGMAVAGRSVLYRDTMTIGSDPTTNCGFGGPTLIVNPAYASTKTDSITTYTTTADFNSGTLTNLITTGSNGITLNDIQRNWDDGDFSNQPEFGGGSFFQQVENKQMVLQTSSGFDVRSQLLFAGQWQNFTAEVDITVVGTGTAGSGGLVYRCTGWQNNNDSYAYVAALSTTQLQLGRGTNSSSGAGAFTNIQIVNITLATNSVHRLKVVANGSNHQIFVDGVLLINVTDPTYGAAGYLGLRTYNNTGSTLSCAFDNFGVCASLSGTWQSPAINIAGPATYGNAEIFWDVDGIPDSTCSITGQTSIDGGSTFQSVTNGGAIPGFTAGQSLTGKTLILKLTLTANNAPVVPVLNGVTAWIMGQYSSTGTRSTAPLAWDNMTRSNVIGGLGTATNGATYTQTGTGTVALTSDEATITNTTGDVHMQIGGVNGTDEETTLRFQISANTMSAGVELRYVDANNYCRLEATLNSLSIIIAIRGVVSTLATATPTINISTWYRMRFRVADSGPINFYGRVWPDDGSAEPSAWSIQTVL